MQRTVEPKKLQSFHIHRVSTAGHATPLGGDAVRIEVIFSLDPLQLEREAGEAPAEVARRLIQHLTADLHEVTVTSTPEGHYRQRAQETITKDFSLAGIAPVWSPTDEPRTAYLVNPHVQAREVNTEGTRTYFQWNESFKANIAVQGIIEHLRDQVRAVADHPSNEAARLQELVNTLNALTYFLA